MNATCHPDRKNHARGQCRPCYYVANRKTIIARSMDYYHKNREKVKHNVWVASLKRVYGLSLEDYKQRLAEQDDSCAICGVKSSSWKTPRKPKTRRHRSLVVDHDHSTKKTRGLLCNRCNVHLWGVEDKEWRAKAEAYLRRWGRKDAN